MKQPKQKVVKLLNKDLGPITADPEHSLTSEPQNYNDCPSGTLNLPPKFKEEPKGLFNSTGFGKTLYREN